MVFFVFLVNITVTDIVNMIILSSHTIHRNSLKVTVNPLLRVNTVLICDD